MITLDEVGGAARALEASGRSLGQRVVLFYSGRGYWLDNFSAFSVAFDGKLYPTAEHAYQALKFDFIQADAARLAIAEVIRTAPSAHEAKKLGGHSHVAALIRVDWSDVKLGIMKMIVRAKWQQHEYIRRKLKETTGLLLVEDSPTDDFWGRGPDWAGQNHLGKIWMEIRDSPQS